MPRIIVGGSSVALDRHELLLAHREQAGEDGEEADRVDREAGADAPGGDDHAGEGRADDARGVEEARVQRDRVRQLVAPDHLEGERVPPGRVEDDRACCESTAST